MSSTNEIAKIASLFGSPARTAILQALMGGRALTAGELAGVAGLSPQTVSGHLAQLRSAGLLSLYRQGRHRYFGIASAGVAEMIERLMSFARAREVAVPRTGPADESMRRARTCYDHLAGRLGVALADGLIARGWLELTEDAGFLTPSGASAMGKIGIDLEMGVDPPKTSLAGYCRVCLDWSERRPHVAGKLGRMMCSHALAAGWVKRRDGTRAVELTPKGAKAFARHFGAELD